MFKLQEVGEEAMAGEAAAGADQLDLEAAEQLIQLSGGDGADADDGGTSESRSADSVNKCCARADGAGGTEKKDKEVAVESRLRRTSGAGNKGGAVGVPAGEPDMKRADSVSNTCSGPDRTGRKENEKEKKVAVEIRRRSAERFPAAPGVDGNGEERRRPRFRWLADLYRETQQVSVATPERRAAGGDVDPPVGERRGKRKRAADADEAMVPEPSKERTMVA